MDNRADVDIDLSLEDWGRVALIAHRLDVTINEAIEHILREAIKEADAQLD